MWNKLIEPHPENSPKQIAFFWPTLLPFTTSRASLPTAAPLFPPKVLPGYQGVITSHNFIIARTPENW